MRIVLIEDADAVRSVLRLILQNAGYEIVGEYSSGVNALRDMDFLQAHIVCLDYYLPDADGLRVLSQLREHHPHMSVVMITGSPDATLERQVVEAGASGFIRKPFSQDQVAKELAQVSHAHKLLERARAAPAAPLVRGRARAVIADDSQALRAVLYEILLRLGIEVVGQAGNGEQAIELCAALQPDLVCLDIAMPVMNGIDAIPSIRAQAPNAKIVMISGRGTREEILQSGKAGAACYIVKPYQPDKVAEVMARLLAG